MRPNDLKQLIKDFIASGIKRPLYIESSPGGGKTEIPGQVATELGIGYIVLHTPLMQPEDYSLPVVSADRTSVEFIVSKSKFPLVNSGCPDKGILLFDEFAQADVASQKILTNLIHEREIHGQKLKDGWTIIATGNRVQDRAGANRILSHLRNRVTSVDLDVSLDDWTQWALENHIKTEVIAFLRFRPDLLNAFDAAQEINATPRSWSQGVSKALGAVQPSVEFEVFKGSVGEGPAAEFTAFLKIFRKLPSPDAIMLNPEKIDVPTDPATLYALCGALANKANGNTFGRIMQYVKRMPPEFGVLFVRDSLRRDKSIAETKEFIAWASTEGAKYLA